MSELHCSGPIWRPPYEANSILIQATTGCTHNKCKFCSLYPRELKFRISPITEVESDLIFLKESGVKSRRVFLTGSNPFVLSYDHLFAIAVNIRKYLPNVETIGCFSRITDIKNKTIQQLKELRHMGYTRITIGIETGDSQTLSYMKKGYSSQEALEQCLKLEEANIEYHFIVLNGLAGNGNGARNAIESVKLYNQLKPTIINITSLTIFPESDLYQDVVGGNYIEASEYERIKELIILIENLKNPMTILANTVSNPIPIIGILPKDRVAMLNELKKALTSIDEVLLDSYRKSIHHL